MQVRQRMSLYQRQTYSIHKMDFLRELKNLMGDFCKTFDLKTLHLNLHIC